MAPFDPYGQSHPQANPLPLLWLRDIAAALIAQDFVQGVLLLASAAVVYGESNSGKTFWTTDMALHVAAGLVWNGRRVDQGGVIYCILEGGNGFRNRVVAWRDKNLAPGEDIPFAAIPASLNLLNPDADVLRLIDAIQAAAVQIGQPVKLVVIDTLSRALAGGDENSSEDMGALVRGMDAIREATGACVLFVHHSGKDAARGARGHSLLRAAIDTEIEVQTGDRGARVATVVKQRDLSKGAAFNFRLAPVVMGKNQHDEDVTSCTVQAEEEGEADRGPVLKPEEKLWLRDVKAFFDDPSRGTSEARPQPDSGLTRAGTRADMRAWLIARGRIGMGGLGADGGLSQADRQKLSRMLTALKDKGSISVFGDWIWLAAKLPAPQSSPSGNP